MVAVGCSPPNPPCGPGFPVRPLTRPGFFAYRLFVFVMHLNFVLQKIAPALNSAEFDMFIIYISRFIKQPFIYFV
jgi:hypothetical protein